MNKDLSFKIDDVKFSVRSGVIIKYENMVLIEFSKKGENSVIPGGRVKIGEKTNLTIKREVKEEMGLDIEIQKLQIKKVFENFFEYNLEKVHEIYFVYEYILSKNEFLNFNKIKDNKDNNTTFFEFINKKDLKDVNLLPTVLLEIMEKG